MKNICRTYFALMMFWRQCHDHLFKATKSEKICTIFCTDWSHSISCLHSISPQDQGLLGGSGIAHTAHMVCKQGNHWAITNNAVSVTTCSHLSRSCWPGCIQPCTEQFSTSKHPTPVPATWLKTRPPKVFQKPLLISVDYSPVAT